MLPPVQYMENCGSYSCYPVAVAQAVELKSEPPKSLSIIMINMFSLKAVMYM